MRATRHLGTHGIILAVSAACEYILLLHWCCTVLSGGGVTKAQTSGLEALLTTQMKVGPYPCHQFAWTGTEQTPRTAYLCAVQCREPGVLHMLHACARMLRACARMGMYACLHICLCAVPVLSGRRMGQVDAVCSRRSQGIKKTAITVGGDNTAPLRHRLLLSCDNGRTRSVKVMPHQPHQQALQTPCAAPDPADHATFDLVTDKAVVHG